MSAIDPYKIMVVVPAFNEQKELPRVVSELARAGYAVVVVDDGSEPH
jgi:glycosyltransferase involved in cell wall biosynthesis